MEVPKRRHETDDVGFDVVTSAERPDLADEASAAFRQRWPEFIFHDAVAKRYLDRVSRYFADYDVLLLDEGRVVAGGWGVALAWDGTYAGLPEGYDATMVRAVEGHEAGTPPTALSFMAAAVHPDHGRRGLAAHVLTALIERAESAGLRHVVAPIRPTEKHHRPELAMAEHASLTRPDGLSVDPWIRAHQRMGAQVLGPAPNSMVITGTVAEWESWAQMSFPTSGTYAVPEALNLLEVDLEHDVATYREENLWVQHR